MALQTTIDKALSRIYGKGRGWVFSPDDFTALGSKSAIWAALSRLCNRGTIRRLARGLYDYPKVHPKLGPVFPGPPAIGAALARSEGARILATGAYAANLLGISDQVPARIVFLTDGRNRTVRVGKTEILLKHASVRQMAPHDRISGLVIQALRFLGQQNTNDRVIEILESKLSNEDRKQLIKDIRYAPDWIAEIFRQWERSADDQ